MNADNFAQYLEDPSLLYQASYQELKSLALQYPYCQNLHLLLFQKSYMEGSGEWEQNLEKAAVYSIDRKHLFQQARNLDRKSEAADTFLLSEEFLELRSLEKLQLEDPPLAEPGKAGLQLEFGPIPQEPSSEQTTEPAKLQPAGLEEEEEEDFDDLFEISAGLAPKEETGHFREEPIAEEPDSGLAEPSSDEQLAPHAEASEPPPLLFQVEDELIEACSSLLHVVELAEGLFGLPAGRSTEKSAKAAAGRQESFRPPFPNPELAVLKQKTRSRPVFTIDSPAEETLDSPKPQPKQSFTSWIEKFQPPNVQGQLSELMESKKREDSKKKQKKKKKAKKARAHSPGVGRLAIRSITENKEILSETLAELLASQGEYQRAIEMYRALMLVFPKKSDYFAVKIENLKSK
ncbi:MAG: hypothetical protein H6557_02110 [Lewinellaceae bacterium]|nr:hypothetical protein [Phaeodactylibacter sp.]MCB9035391.1 hypothetical protein [Lewinellaceae bacterium]